jgi:HK97 family phage prohead protease
MIKPMIGNQNMSIEKRTIKRPLDIRAADSGRTIGGYAAVFNSEADIGGYFRDVIAPGAFDDAMAQDVRALVDHDTGRVIGRTKAGTLRMKQDDTGLAVEIDLPDTSDGRDLGTLIERGDISGMSFGFVVTKETWDETQDPPMRTIQALDLHEVSVVAFPAYDDTSIAMRSLGKVREDAERDRAQHNRKQAEARIAERKAASEHKFRRING